VASIIKKIDQLPLDAIGDELKKAIVELDRTLVSARGTLDSATGALDSGRGTLDNANKLIEPNSVLAAELANTLQEVTRAARSVRVLADFLERHPEALIRGKTGEAQ
jgi:paraquat-inducible protein B